MLPVHHCLDLIRVDVAELPEVLLISIADESDEPSSEPGALTVDDLADVVLVVLC